MRQACRKLQWPFALGMDGIVPLTDARRWILCSLAHNRFGVSTEKRRAKVCRSEQKKSTMHQFSKRCWGGGRQVKGSSNCGYERCVLAGPRLSQISPPTTLGTFSKPHGILASMLQIRPTQFHLKMLSLVASRHFTTGMPCTIHFCFFPISGSVHLRLRVKYPLFYETC